MSQHGTLTETVNSVEYGRVSTSPNTSNGTITIKKTCNWTARDSYTPAVNTAYPTNSAYTLQNATQVQKAGGLCEITLFYATQFEALPPTTVVEQSSQEVVDIQQHPKFSDWAADWDEEKQRFKLTSTKAGITSYVKGTTQVSVTEYFSLKPASRMADIGTLESPGAGYGLSANWLIIASNRGQQGAFWTRTTTYLYSAKPYDADIY